MDAPRGEIDQYDYLYYNICLENRINMNNIINAIINLVNSPKIDLNYQTYSNNPAQLRYAKLITFHLGALK